MKDRETKGIENIIRHIELINEYMLVISDLIEFTMNTMVVDAVTFNLMQIGEISKNKISNDIKQKNPHIPWEEIYGFRNRLVHDYASINQKIVYETIIEDLPLLLNVLKAAINTNNK